MSSFQRAQDPREFSDDVAVRGGEIRRRPPLDGVQVRRAQYRTEQGRDGLLLSEHGQSVLRPMG
nr:hypothetical protein [Methylobacterium sp. WL64]